MADAKISALPAAAPATGGILAGVQSGITSKFTCTAAGAAMFEAASVAAQKTLLGIGAVGAQIAALATIAAGSMLYASATDTVSTLAPGTEAQIMTMIGGVPTWSNSVLASTNAAVIYWDGTQYALGGATFAPTAASPFVKSINTENGGQDTGFAFYQTSSVDGILLAGTIGIAAPAAYTDPSTEYTQMYFTVKDSAGALTEAFRLGSALNLSQKPLYIAAAGSAVAPSLRIGSAAFSGLFDPTGEGLGFAGGSNHIFTLNQYGIYWNSGDFYFFGAAAGVKIGAYNSDKMGFWGATPIVQPANTTDLRAVLISTGFLASGGASPLDLNGGSLTALNITATGLGLFAASTAGAGGYASIRLPHGAAPTTNLTDGDVWTTTAGLFARINGATTAFGAGTVTGTGSATAIAIWNSTTGLTQNTAFTISGTALLGVASAANAAVQFTTVNSATTGNATSADINTINSAGYSALLRSYGVSHTGTIAGIAAANAVGLGGFGGVSKIFYGQLDAVGAATIYFISAGVDALHYTNAAITLNLPTSITGDVTITGKLAGFTADVIIDSSTARTLSSADYGRVIRFTNGGAITVTVPSTLPVGFTCTMIQDGAGQILVSAGAGATVQNVDSQYFSKAQNAVLSLISLVATKTTLAGATA